ncbi:unnamed protein product [Cunninghamella blakesleeana]
MSSPLHWQSILNTTTPITDQTLQTTQQQAQQQQQQQHVHESQIANHNHLSLRPIQPLLNTSGNMTQHNYEPYAYPTQFNNQQTQINNFNEPDMKRMRISRACDTCRRKKVKCDTVAGGPCKNCKASKIECTYNDSAKKRGPPKGYIEVLENRLKRMEKILGGITNENMDADQVSTNKKYKNKNKKRSDSNENVSLDQLRTDQSGYSPTDYNLPTSLTTPGSYPTSTPGLIPANSETKKESLALRSAPSAITKVKHPNIGTNTENIEKLNVSISDEKKFAEAPSLSEIHPRYIGDMSTLPFLAEKFNFEDERFAFMGVKIRKFGQSLVVYGSESGRIANQELLERLGITKPGEIIKDLDDWILKIAGIDKLTSDQLLKVYFAYIHPGLPVVNKVFFLRQYRSLSSDYPSAPLLNAMYGAALRYIETCKVFGDNTAVQDALGCEIADFQIPEGGSEKFFENLIAYCKGKYNPNIATIQALVITQNHRASMDTKVTGAWLINAAAIRMAQDLGLHRSSELWDIPESEKETRRRVWWAVYIMDKWSAASTGRPQTIFDEDCDELYPSDSASWEEVLDIPTDEKDNKPGPRFPSLDKSIAKRATCEKIPIYQPFVQLIKLSEILGHVLQGLYTPQAKKYSAEHGSDAIVTCLDKALSDWRAALPPTLQISGSSIKKLDAKGKTPLLSISGLMYLSYCTLLILLHRPFIEKEGGEKTKSSQSALSICASAAKKCVDMAYKMHYRDFLLVSWNFGIYQVFTASLIHIHLATNPVNSISEESKKYIIKSIRVVKRLARFAVGAVPIHQVLLRLVKAGNIPYNEEDDSDEDTIIKIDKSTSAINNDLDNKHHKSNAKKNKSKSSTTATYNNNSNNNNSNSNSNIYKESDNYTSPNKLENVISGMSPRVSDVGRGQTPGKCNQSPDSQYFTASVHTQDDRSSGCSTPGSLNNGDWINGLYSSFQGSEAPVVNLGRGIDDSDPDSLRQFGISMEQLFTPIAELNMSTTNTATTSNNNTSNMTPMNQQYNMQPYGLPQNFWFGFSNIGQPYNTIINNHANNNATNTATNNTNNTNPNNNSNMFTSVPSNLPNQTTQPNNIINYAYQNSIQATQHAPQITNNNSNNSNSNNVVDQTLFRNRPDNPFYSVPSSIELNDWLAYLLPQNSNIQQTDQQNQQQNLSSTWM